MKKITILLSAVFITMAAITQLSFAAEPSHAVLTMGAAPAAAKANSFNNFSYYSTDIRIINQADNGTTVYLSMPENDPQIIDAPIHKGIAGATIQNDAPVYLELYAGPNLSGSRIYDGMISGRHLIYVYSMDGVAKHFIQDTN